MEIATNASLAERSVAVETVIADKLYGQYLDNILISELYG